MVVSRRADRRAALLRRWVGLMAARPALCAVPGCYQRGLYSDNTKGAGPWFCRRHQRARDNRAPSRARLAADLAFYAPTPGDTDNG